MLFIIGARDYVWTLHGCDVAISLRFVFYPRDKTMSGNNTFAYGQVSVILLLQVVRAVTRYCALTPRVVAIGTLVRVGPSIP